MRVLFVAVLCLIALGGHAAAFRLSERPLHEKVAAANLVVIARAIKVSPTDAAGRPCEVTKFAVEQTLKGASASVVEMGQSAFAESRVRCPVIGARYLLFLSKNNTGKFVSVNGMFGV